MISRSRPSSVPRIAPPTVMEEYTLNERELAALEQLYDFPGRAGLAASSAASSSSSSSPAVRAVSIMDTLSQMARSNQRAPLGQLTRATAGEVSCGPNSEMSRGTNSEMSCSSHSEMGRSPKGEVSRGSNSEMSRGPNGDVNGGSPSATNRDLTQGTTSGATNEVSGTRHSEATHSPSGKVLSETVRDSSAQRRLAGGGSRSGCTTPIDAERQDTEVKLGGTERGAMDTRIGDATVNESQDTQQADKRQTDPQQADPRQAESRQAEPRQAEPRQGPQRESPWPGPSPLGREAAIARLLAEAARGPTPPVPSRRPDLTRLNLPRRSRGCSRSQRRPQSHARHDFTAGSADRVRVVFDLARDGDITKLDEALSVLEPSAARALVDRHGNTVAHVLAACGHVAALAWLADTCHHGLADTLWQENGRGLTPCLAAVRCGRLEVVKWLVERSPIRSHLLPGEGAGSLLHAAARHGQVDMASWCADRLLQHRTDLDGQDRRRDAPLHLAAGAGNTLVCRALLDRGASVTARNACGLKPYDVAAQRSQHACAEYLLTFETLADLAGDFCSLEAEAARLSRDNADYKDNFREVLSVARKLLRERTEMSGALRQLRDDWQLLQERLLRQLQLAAAEQRQLRRRLHEQEPTAGEGGQDQPVESASQAELTEQLTALRDRWQHCGAANGDTLLTESQSRLQAAETLWHRLRASRKESTEPLTSVQEIVRNKIGDIRAQAAAGRLLDSSALSSEEEDSLVESQLLHGTPPTPPPRPAGCTPPSALYTPSSALYTPPSADRTTPFSDRVPSSLSCTPASADRATPSVSLTPPSNRATNENGGGSGEPADSRFPNTSPDGSRLARRDLGSRRRSSHPTHLPHERRGKSVDSLERSSRCDAGGGGLWPSAELSRSLDWSTEPRTDPGSPRRRASAGNESVQLARAELRRRLRQLALVSESGSAAVLDVIEPSGSEAGSAEDLVQREVEAQRRARARSAPPRPGSRSSEMEQPGDLPADRGALWGDVGGDDDYLLGQTIEVETETPRHWRAASRPVSPGRCSGTDGSERRGRPQRSRRADRTPPGRTPPGSAPVLSAPDILQGTRHWRDPGEESDEPPPEKPDLPLFQLDSSAPAAAAADAAAAAATAAKKRGFLHKFAIRARWTPRRKERPSRPGQEITAVEFRETYPAETHDTLTAAESAATGEGADHALPLLRGGAVSPTESGHASQRSRSHLNETRSETDSGDAQQASAASERDFLAGGSTGDLFTAVCVTTFADSTSESSRSQASRRSGQTTSPVKPLLSGGPAPSEAVSPRAAGATGADASRPAGGVSRPASSASVVTPGRHSPAHSEASRTESTLAPPSDVSGTESARHLAAAAATGGATKKPTAAPQKATRTSDGAPVIPASEAKQQMAEKSGRPRRDDRPWYEISDDD